MFNFFSEYNFTIDENDPNDAEVGVDPEMLGKIFENLLEDNKDKGAFYTPKEIVRYMCQESLIAYLDTATSIAAEKIRKFVITPEEGVSDIPENKKGKLLDALKDVKICDPAIGSGAFPMGLLNELLKCREALLGTRTGNGIMETSIKYENEIKNIQPSFPSPYLVPNSRSQIKKDIIQNNIYGVDIEKGAVDIARLRFWLSIVVDEETPSPLPNLDYKIMQGNSLIESYRGLDLSKLTYAKKGFDIVIGNPPYVVVNKKDYPQYEWNTDLYKMFYELGVKKLLACNGCLNFITPKFWMLNLEDELMRKYFSNNMFIKHISLCNPFETAVTENSIILFTNKHDIQKEIPLYKYNNESRLFEENTPIDIEYCLTNLHYEWTIGIDKSIITLLSKLSNNIKLKEISTSKRGAEISKKNMRDTMVGIPSLIGQDMKKYSIQWDNTYIDIKHKEFGRLASFFNNELIYLRRVDVCLEATVSDIPYGFNKNVYGIKIDEKKGFKTKFVLGLLNSKLLDFYYKKKFSTKKEDVFPEIQTYLYEQLPIPQTSQSLQKEIIDIVDDILQIKKNDSGADASLLEQEIDKLVYKLYGLTEEEIRVVEGK
ncbi:MAG: Eco57I restriction-modification methylase domain-containing protein [Bacteroidales bacterium]|nr:Eco57I restriction-modification methylase domain-containing protein [Bacteroidales bacterium]